MKDVPALERFNRCEHVVWLLLSVLMFALSPSPASAEKIGWLGTLQFDLGRYPPLKFAGSGVATVDNFSGGSQLGSLRIAGGITGTGTIPITDPDITATYRSLRVSPWLGTGTLGPFWPVKPWPEPQLSRNTIPVRGSLRMCMFFPGCVAGIIASLSRHSGAKAVGVGGIVTEGGFGSFRISIEAAPWTVYSTTLIVDTIQGGTAAWVRSGWIHGPASSSSSAAATDGALQLVTPLVVRSSTGMVLPGFASLTLRFVPEPGTLLMLGSGVVGLGILSRNRMKP